MQVFSVLLVALANAAHVSASWAAIEDTGVVEGYSNVFQQKPPDPPAYMVDNTDNLSGQAPNKGKYNGPVWPYSGSFENYMERLHRGEITGTPTFPNATATHGNTTLHSRQSGGYWLPSLAPLGKQPLAGDGYVFYRDVTEYGASNKGDVDVSEAINAAIQDGNRCGLECGNTFSQGAIIYFPAGTYKICTPIIQLYYTQFIGDANDRPIIKGCDEFTGIALMDTDPYVPNDANPDGTGVNWYINQNQFFRQIRNFVFDLTEMPLKTDENGQPLVPTGIHWQVSQACSLQNLLFKMPEATGEGSTTHVGIFTENGSGGFVSDLEFQGGAIGWRVGSQQYTARGLKFTNCITSIQMVWDWGFNWQDIEVNGGSIALNISGKGGVTGQGIGSISLIDSSINNVPIGILTRKSSAGDAPNIVIDNTAFNGVNAPVQVENGDTLLSGSQKVDLWATGQRYMSGDMDGAFHTGFVTGRPTKPAALLGSNGKLFTRSRPQYENLGVGSFLIATENGCSNDGSGDNTAAINSFLEKAAAASQVAYFPAGIYSVGGTVHIPVNSKIVGASWSQIQATGDYFADMKKPQVVVRVGYDGDEGTLEITDMIFSVKGPTAGAIMVEWNVKESSPGAAGMWDTHIRVGGALGSDLDHANCPKFGYSEACITASLLFHATPKSSGYFENVWAWVADHDNDMSIYWEFDKLASQISIYAGRGMLIESQGPMWFYGTGSEHTILYQYQLHKAKNIYMGHIQTETPYFQPEPVAPTPFENSVALGKFNADPSFDDCTSDGCKEAWGLRILDSEDVMVHSAGLYSWFINYQQQCLTTEDCQEKIMQVRGSARVAVFNLFTKGVTQVSTGSSNRTNIWQSDNKQGYTTEISLFFPPDGSDNIVYLGPEIYTSFTAQCEAPCTLVLPPSTLGSSTTISIPPYTTSLEVGSSVGTGFVVTTTTVTITIAPITTDKLPQSNVEVDDGQTGGFVPTPSVTISHSTVKVTDGNGRTTDRIVTFPPWPQITNGPPEQWSSQSGPWGGGNPGTTPEPTNTGGGGHGITPWFPGVDPMTLACSENTLVLDPMSATVSLDRCDGVRTLDWNCPPTKTVPMLAAPSVTLALGCTLFTGTRVGGADPTTTTSDVTPVPVLSDFYPVPTQPTEEEKENNDDDEELVYLSCDMWFFNICIDWPELKVFGWWLRWRPGKYCCGPPNMRWPPTIKIKGTLPRWPTLTIPTNGPVPTPSKPSNCKTETAEICRTTSSFGVSVSGTVTRTTATSTGEQCATVYGCQVTDEARTTTTASACTYSPVSPGRRDTTPHDKRQNPGNPCGPTKDLVVFPRDPKNVGPIRQWIIQNGFQYTEVAATRVPGGFTAFFYVQSLSYDQKEDFLFMNGVQDAYFVQEHRATRYQQMQGLVNPQPGPPAPVPRPRSLDSSAAELDELTWLNKTDGLRKRAVETQESPYWEVSQISSPKGESWMQAAIQEPAAGGGTNYKYYYHDSAGAGQYIYAVERGLYLTHEEFRGKVAAGEARVLPEFVYGGEQEGTFEGSKDHGTSVAAKAVGRNLGVAKRASIVIPQMSLGGPTGPAGSPQWWAFFHSMPSERILASFVTIMDDIMTPDATGRDKVGRAVINYSNGEFRDLGWTSDAGYAMLEKIILELQSLKTLVVASAHNEYLQALAPFPHQGNLNGRGDDMSDIPVAWADPSSPRYLSNLLVVSATDINTRVGPINPFANWVSFAPGVGINLPKGVSGDAIDGGHDGASFATPMVAGVAAYLRGLPSRWATDLQDPRHLKALIKLLQRRIPDFPAQPAYRPNGKQKVATVWNGQIFDKSCLLDTKQANPSNPGFQGDSACPNIDDIFRPDADKALLPNSGNPTWDGPTIAYQPGAPSPTCTIRCGTLCTGFYCLPSPTGVPPDYWDPEDPVHKTATAPPRTTTTTTSATPSSTPNITPLQRGPINCFREADFPGHGDIQSGDQHEFAVEFSGLRVGNDDTIGPGDAPLKMRRTDGHGINYDYRVEWVAGCETTVPRQNYRFPLSMSSPITAYLLVRENYEKCINGGVGGTCQVGCLLYTFEGGRGGEEVISCADQCPQGCGSPFDTPGCQDCCQRLRAAVAMTEYSPSNHSHYVPGEGGGFVVDDLKQ